MIVNRNLRHRHISDLNPTELRRQGWLHKAVVYHKRLLLFCPDHHLLHQLPFSDGHQGAEGCPLLGSLCLVLILVASRSCMAHVGFCDVVDLLLRYCYRYGGKMSSTIS